jgi:hypothetical protein
VRMGNGSGQRTEKVGWHSGSGNAVHMRDIGGLQKALKFVLSEYGSVRWPSPSHWPAAHRVSDKKSR